MLTFGNDFLCSDSRDSTLFSSANTKKAPTRVLSVCVVIGCWEVCENYLLHILFLLHVSHEGCELSQNFFTDIIPADTRSLCYLARLPLFFASKENKIFFSGRNSDVKEESLRLRTLLCVRIQASSKFYFLFLSLSLSLPPSRHVLILFALSLVMQWHIMY